MTQLFAAEGTTATGTELLQFKKGPFIPGVPIQVYLMDFPEWMDRITGNIGPTRSCTRGTGWAGWGEDISFLYLIWHNLTTPWQPVRVKILPEYHPSTEEINDPKLYANNLQKYVSEVSGIPISKCSNHDVNLYVYVSKKYPDVDADYFKAEFHVLEDTFGKLASRATVKSLLDDFLARSEGGVALQQSQAPDSLRCMDFPMSFKTFVYENLKADSEKTKTE